MSLRSHVNRWRSSTFFITAVICYAVFVHQVFFVFILPVLPYSLPEKNGIAEDRGEIAREKEGLGTSLMLEQCSIGRPLRSWYSAWHVSSHAVCSSSQVRDDMCR